MYYCRRWSNLPIYPITPFYCCRRLINCCIRWPISSFFLPCEKNIRWNPLWNHLLWLSRREEGSCKCVFLFDTYSTLTRWPEVTCNMEVIKGFAGRRLGLLQVCITLLTLSAIYEGVGKEVFQQYRGIIIGAQVGGLTIKTPPKHCFQDPPPSILFMTPPPPENPLNNVLVQQMFAKMKNFAAYGGITYTFFHHTFF